MSQTSSRFFFTSLTLLFSASCSGTVDPPSGSTSSTGGTGAFSGASSAKGSTNGGTLGTGGATTSGGAATTPGFGGAVTAGGASAMGGAPNGGATASGGASTTAGSQPTSGSSAMGGAPSTAGGTSTAGAPPAGGASATGGTGGGTSGAGKATSGGTNNGSGGVGGKATAGASSMGGTSAAGSTSAGGTAAGGVGTQPYKGVANSACADLTTLKASWWYNWMLSPGSCAAREFVPMIAGKNEKTTAAVANAITQVGNAGYRTVLGFNEPNKVDQSNMSVAQVVGLWPALTTNPSIRVGSTATSADAMAFFSDFMTQVSAQSLRVDFVAVHWYGWNAGSCDANALTLENYIKWAEAIPGNLPIWITEWGCMNLSNPNRATVEAFFTGALAMFQRHPRIERYAWYPWNTHNELVEAGGGLTPLGRLFAAAPSYK